MYCRLVDCYDVYSCLEKGCRNAKLHATIPKGNLLLYLQTYICGEPRHFLTFTWNAGVKENLNLSFPKQHPSVLSCALKHFLDILSRNSCILMIAQLGHLRQRFISIQCYRWNINAGDYFWGMWNGMSLKFSSFKWTEDWNNSTISDLSCKWTKFLQQIIVYQLLSPMFLQSS